MLAAVTLAAGITGLAAPLASAAPAVDPDAGKVNPISTLDTLVLSDIPKEHQAGYPKISEQAHQLQNLNQLEQGLGELHQLTDLVAPVTNLLGS